MPVNGVSWNFVKDPIRLGGLSHGIVTKILTEGGLGMVTVVVLGWFGVVGGGGPGCGHQHCLTYRGVWVLLE